MRRNKQMIEVHMDSENYWVDLALDVIDATLVRGTMLIGVIALYSN